MTRRSRETEGATRRRLLQTGAAAIPVMVTIKAARAQVNGPTQEMLGSIACLRNAAIPEDYRFAVEEVADKLGLAETDQDLQPSAGLTPDASVPGRPGGWIGSRMGESMRQGGISTQGMNRRANYQDWTYDDVVQYFRQGTLDFYPGAEYNPGSQYHNTFLEITMSTACWDSVRTQMARS